MPESEKKGESRTVHPVNPVSVKEGDLMAFTYYGVVKSAASSGGQHRLHVRGLGGSPEEFHVNGDSLIIASASADQYHEERKVTKTQAAELLVSSYGRPFTVCFTKKDGSERKLRGRLVQPEPLLGRSHVEDLDVEGPDRLRLVDHRTISTLTVDGVRYSVK